VLSRSCPRTFTGYLPATVAYHTDSSKRIGRHGSATGTGIKTEAGTKVGTEGRKKDERKGGSISKGSPKGNTDKVNTDTTGADGCRYGRL
jgi:hypothetical protein